jgi:hypothetical protein
MPFVSGLTANGRVHESIEDVVQPAGQENLLGVVCLGFTSSLDHI